VSAVAGLLDFIAESGVIRLHPAVSSAQQSNKFFLAITGAPGIATIKVAVTSASRSGEATLILGRIHANYRPRR
jgi:hypothetical protein